jgi:hypothetical protein
MNATPETDDSLLLAYLDGAVDEATAAAIAASPDLQARATALAAEQSALQRRLFRAICPPSLALGEYALGLLVGADRAVVADHVAHCPHCRTELKEAEGFLASSAMLIDRLSHGLQTVMAAFQGGEAPRTTLVLGVRGGADGPLFYEAGAYQVSIEVQDDGGDQRALLGLLLGEAESAWEAVLLRGDEVAATAPLDELGNFAFHGLPAGSHTLLLRSETLLIQMPPLDV